MYLHPACNHKEGFGASLNCSISYQILGGGQEGLSRESGARRWRRAINSDTDESYYFRHYRYMKGSGEEMSDSKEKIRITSRDGSKGQ